MTWTLHLGDCLDPATGLASLAIGSVDHVITDPPYSPNVYAKAKRVNPGAEHRRSEVEAMAALAAGRIGMMGREDVLTFVGQIRRVARRWIVVFHDAESWPWYLEAMGDAHVRCGVWIKPDAMPQFTGDRPSQGFEAITIGHAEGRKVWHGGGRPAVWTFGTERDRSSGHPCPKPLPLMEALVRDFTAPGETILDPFAGSGTTLAACIRLGRNAIGWERDPKYHAIAMKRLEGTREQLTIPRARAPRPRQVELELDP